MWFKAAWTAPFSAGQTQDGEFHVSGGTTVKAPMMHRVGSFACGESEGAQLLEINDGSGDASLLVVLPKTADGLAAVTGAETPASWVERLSPSTRVDVRLPRFRFANGFDLSAALKALGLRQAFDRQHADFSGLSNREPFFIGLVIHKTFITVNEEGTEAAAATAVAVHAGAPPRTDDPIPFVADHPFLFAIRHRPTGTILFLGRVTNPTAGQ